MRKKRWLRSTVSFVLIAVMCLGLTLSGNLGRVLAEDTENLLVNGDFGVDIWDEDEDGGWSTDGTEWGAKDDEGNNTTTVECANETLSFWQKEAGTVKLSQSVENLEAGTYQLSVKRVDGEKYTISLLFGGETAEVEGTGVQSKNFTLETAGTVVVGVSIAVEDGGWGHIDDISLKKIDTTESTEEDTEEGDSESGGDTEEGDSEEKDPVDDSIVYQDDMENAPDPSWSVEWETKAGTSQKKTDAYATNNTTEVWNIASESAQKVTITRKINVEAGNYTASVESDGANIESGKITISDGTNAKEAAMGFVAWDSWTTATAGVLEVADSAELTLTIEVDLKAGGWFDLDNVKVKAVSEDETAAEKAKKIEELQALIAGCGSLVESEYTAESWQTLQDALTDANAVIADKESKTVEEISAACQALQTAKEGLAFSVPEVDGDLNVERIAGLPSDFIMGMDISSVMSEFASGVTYKDYDGNTIDNIADFCKLLKANGITHIRVRVWNDPFDAAGNGYGGGNNDVAPAKAIADGCRSAGRVYICALLFLCV